MPTLRIVSYLVGTDAFMSLHKPIITLFLTPKISFYEFTNSFHAKYKPISFKCWPGRTYGQRPIKKALCAQVSLKQLHVKRPNKQEIVHGNQILPHSLF